ncbi:MAG: glycosyltransferase family 2 protein [Roseococcus sp.]|nr:glycosyltransferase family 2 protein [Roseococcus sp.]
MEISVIIPTWNRAALLPETLDAVFAQTHPPLEVIVVDDGSTDQTAEMVTERYGARVRLLQIANGGDLAARNAGLAVASGRLVAFCDSDDLWRPDFLAAMAALWFAEPRLRAAFADFVLLRDGVCGTSTKFADAPEGFWQGLRVLAPEGLAAFDKPIVERVIGFQPFFPSAMVADRQFLLALGGWDASVGRTVGTDFATILLLCEHPPIGIVHRPLVMIRKHPGGYSADVQAMNLGDAAILEHVLARRPSLRPLDQLIAESVARRRVQALEIAFARQDHAAVRGIWRLLPEPSKAWPLRMKAGVAAWRSPWRDWAVRGLLAIGTLRARVSSGRAARRAARCERSGRAGNPAAG